MEQLPYIYIVYAFWAFMGVFALYHIYRNLKEGDPLWFEPVIAYVMVLVLGSLLLMGIVPCYKSIKTVPSITLKTEKLGVVIADNETFEVRDVDSYNKLKVGSGPMVIVKYHNFFKGYIAPSFTEVKTP